MGILFWIAVWVMMLLAFGTAWTFIVKGCEAIDEDETTDPQTPAEH